jgi:drug/metabolite transporter (DMT)-like permease
MTLKYWMVIKGIVVVFSGIAFMVIPEFVFNDLLGMNLEEGGILISRLFGLLFIFEGMVLWCLRNTSRLDPAMRAIIPTIVVIDTIGFVVTLIATLNDVWNAVGWLFVGLYLLFASVFAYYLFARSR